MNSTASRRRIATSVANVMFTNAVYFPNFKIYDGATPGMLNYSCISHVFYAFASVAADGSVFLSDEWADTQAPCDGVCGGLGSLMHLKQAHPHLQVILSIGGGNSNEVFPIVASNPTLRDNFGHSARGLVDASGFDGIDICWEYPADSRQGANFIALLASVRLHLTPENYFVTAALPATQSVLRYIDIYTAAGYLDMINLMAYDFFGSWTSRSGHHSQLYGLNKDDLSGSSGISYLVNAGCPAKKINMGIPLYGRSFLGVSGPGHRFKGAGGDSGTYEYRQLPRKGTKENVDKRVGAAMCVGGDGGFVSYDNPDTVKMKASYVKQKRLGGLFYWNGPADAHEKSRSLVATGFKTLHSS